MAWLGALGWLIAREYRPGASSEAEASATARLPPATTFYAVRAEAGQVGLASITMDTLPDGLRVTSRSDVDVPLPLVPRRLLSTTDAIYDRQLRLRSFSTTASGEAGQLTIAATVVDDTTLAAVLGGRGLSRPDTVVLRIPAGVLLADAVPLDLASRGALKPGTTTTAQVIDPIELTVRPWELRAGAESTFVVADSAALDSASGGWVPAGHDTTRATQVSWTEHGLPVHAWIDRQGRMVERSTPLGLTYRRSPYEIVNSGYTRRRPRTVQAAPLEVPSPEGDSGQPVRMSLGVPSLRGLAADLTTGWQVVDAEGVDTRTGPPIAAGPAPPIADSVPAGDREAGQSTTIALAARRILGGGSIDGREAVTALATWIRGTIQPGSPTFEGVEETLRRRRGDSSDRAALFVAMSRSIGIPARPVAGLLVAGGRFRYRAWAEVWLGRWVPVDPTLGQFPADPGHVRLLTHSTARPAAIIPLLGAVRPALLPTNPAP